MANPKTFEPKIIKRVTMPTLKLVPDMPVYVKILDKIFEGKTPKLKEGEKKEDQKQAPWLFNVVNLETGENMQLVAAAVIRSEIVDNYPKDAYVNKCFMIVKGKKKDLSGGRGYFTYEIAEIEEPKA
jgi:hypothetical protein